MAKARRDTASTGGSATDPAKAVSRRAHLAGEDPSAQSVRPSPSTTATPAAAETPGFVSRTSPSDTPHPTMLPRVRRAGEGGREPSAAGESPGARVVSGGYRR